MKITQGKHQELAQDWLRLLHVTLKSTPGITVSEWCKTVPISREYFSRIALGNVSSIKESTWKKITKAGIEFDPSLKESLPDV